MARILILIATFTSAFLLFIIQPLYAKFLLPYFGGTPSVWTISVFFYSVTLLLGYIYSALLSEWEFKKARLIHSTLLVLAGALLLFRILAGESPLLVGTVEHFSPALSVFLTLLLGIGLPVLMLASTSVIAQHLYAKLTDKEPYSLYALSNVGSLLGLSVYPFLVEPFSTLPLQSGLWAFFFIVFVILLITAWRETEKTIAGNVVSVSVGRTKEVVLNNRGTILLMAAIPTFMLVAVTEFLSKGIASFPLMWVIPLMLYLISFIVSFRDRGVSKTKIPFGFYTLASFLPVYGLLSIINSSTVIYWVSFFFLNLAFFLVCVYFHSRVYSMRPRVKDLGSFYIWLTFGGALGSGIVGLLLPLILNDQIELFIVLGLITLYLVQGNFEWMKPNVNILSIRATQGILILLAFLFAITSSSSDDALVKERNFFGTLSVFDVDREVNGETIKARVIVNGEINHGMQTFDNRYKSKAASYYGPSSGIDVAIRSFVDNDFSPRINVVGLGAGMMNAYCEQAESISYIEINPAVEEIAREYFTYLEMCPDKTKVAIGDGRLVLEKEVASGEVTYDVIMIDAFTDDAIPSHLLTKEAFDNAYDPLLSDKGVVAFHVTNRYLNLYPPIVGVARASGYEAVIVSNIPDGSNKLHLPTYWVLVTKPGNIETLLGYENVREYTGKEIIWTDHKNSVMDVLSLEGSNIVE